MRLIEKKTLNVSLILSQRAVLAELLPKSIAILRWRWLVRKTQHPVPLTQKRGCGGTHLRHFVDGKKLINTLKPIAACGENTKEEGSGDEQPEVSASNKVMLNAKSDPFQHYSIGRRLGGLFACIQMATTASISYSHCFPTLIQQIRFKDNTTALLLTPPPYTARRTPGSRPLSRGPHRTHHRHRYIENMRNPSVLSLTTFGWIRTSRNVGRSGFARWLPSYRHLRIS